VSAPAAPDVVSEVPADRFEAADLTEPGACPPEALVYFLVNIGDGDTQLLLLPRRKAGGRRAVVVDIGSTGKLPALIEQLAEHGVLEPIVDDPFLFPLVIATHPHNDHIAGMPEFLDRFKKHIRELWEPGYYHPTVAYIEMMRALEDADGAIQHTQPTSGTMRFIGRVAIQVLAPSIGLRNRYDSYGININNASIAVKVDFPASRVEWEGKERNYVRVNKARRRLLLGADSQTLSWGHVLEDFPALESSGFPAFKALRMAKGTDPLKSDVFKIPHHGSKHGVNLELVEEVAPTWNLISSVAGGGEYNFPHLLAQEAVREAREATSSTGRKRKDDWKLGIHYTSARDSTGAPLGTIALVIPPTGPITMWRFGDTPREDVNVANARRFRPPSR
jgi:hypothetical protein